MWREEEGEGVEVVLMVATEWYLSSVVVEAIGSTEVLLQVQLTVILEEMGKG